MTASPDTSAPPPPRGSTDASRYVSITFDDGLIVGARKATSILGEFNVHATFYVVTGWVRPRQVPYIRDRWNRGCDHGSWDDWRAIQSDGHEVGSHTVTHLNAGGKLAGWFPALVRWELSHSRAQIKRHLGFAPASISMPWNTPTKSLEPCVRRFYPACRLGTRNPQVNNLAGIDWHRLQSWAPDSDLSAATIIEQVRATPPGHWLILQFHSFDGEGYMPLTSEKFREVLRGLAATRDLHHLTVNDMLARFRPHALPPRPGRSAPRKKARICLITSEHLATNPRLVKEADALAGAGYDVRVVSCQWTDWGSAEDARLMETRHWRNDIVDFTRKFSPSLFWRSRFRRWIARHLETTFSRRDGSMVRAVGRVVPEMIREAAAEPADLFIGHNIAALPATVLAARAQGVSAAFDAEDMHSAMWEKETGPRAHDRLVADIEKRFLPRCAYVNAAAPLIAEAYAKRYRIPLPATILNVFPKSDRPAEFRRHDPSAPLTLYWFSQTIGVQRGLEEIIRAVALTGSKNIQFHLRGQWQAGYELVLRRLAREAGLHDSQLIVHKLSPPDDMVRLSAEYDIGLALEHPVSENRDICITNKICTYLLAGNAVIATATRGQRRLMAEMPGSGLCYEIGDVQAVARQLIAWEHDRNAVEGVRRRAWDLGDTQYNWCREREKFLTIVERALVTRPLAP